MTRLGPPKPVATAGAIAAIVLVAGALSLSRPGYSVDEEFTVFAVRGIDAHGIPLLPSRLIYDRGLGYSYAGWLAKSLTGAELPAYRAISLGCAAMSVFLAFVLMRRVANELAALLGALLLATSMPFWATATTGRFYAPFLVIFLAYLICLTHRSYWTLIVVLGAAARLTHELGFLLAAAPAVCVLVASGNRRHWFKVTAATVLGLVVGQAVLFLLHYSAPSSGETMVRRFFLWQVLNLFERPGGRQFMVPLVVLIAGVLIAPRRAWTVAVSALAVAAAIVSFSVAQATNSAALSWPLVQSVLVEGSRYPLDMFWHMLRLTPLTIAIALLCIAYRARHAWPASHRAAHALWMGWVLWFGFIESGITTNYLLLPTALVLMAIAVDVSSIGVPRAALAAIVLAVGVEQWRSMPLDAARPTIVGGGIEEIRAELQPTDRIACTDELGCMMLVGRIDRWLALDDYLRERFLVRRGDGPATGVYTGVPAAFRPADLFSPFDSGDAERSLAQGKPVEAGSLPDRVVIVDIFKEYPIGHSRTWLPKAIEEDGLQVVPLLETPQLRVLQVSPPKRLVRRAD